MYKLFSFIVVLSLALTFGCSDSDSSNTTSSGLETDTALSFPDVVPDTTTSAEEDSQNSLCGNGNLDQGEECDDGNLIAGDGCSPTCTQELSLCGNGALNPGEECDDGNLIAGDGCSPTCTKEEVTGPICGNMIQERGEECDDGNLIAGDGCSPTCTVESTGPVCGNGVRESNEQCDGFDIGAQSCEDFNFNGGVLTCNPDCTLNTSQCLSGPACGDGVVNGDEECDGTDLNHKSCQDLNFAGGTLGCAGDCHFDTSFCYGSGGYCGDGKIDQGEVCDTTDLGGESCQSQGYAQGTLSCRPDCQGFILSNCSTGYTCGDGSVNQSSESCDGLDLNGKSCLDLGFNGGTLSCNADCTFNTSQCESGGNAQCGNNVIETGETCDGTALGGTTCESLGYAGGTLACSPDCMSFNAVNCLTSTVPPEWTCSESYYGANDGCDCGCGAVDPDCADATINSCEYCGNTGSCNSGPCPGEIQANNNALCNVSGSCGDGVLNQSSESCDGSDLGGMSCQDLGFTDGTLSCNADCTFNTSQCNSGSGAQCGNDVIESGETCDGTALGGSTCESLGYSGGTLGCASDCSSYDTSNCNSTPSEWTCNASYYGANDGCDCGCGIVDPDCADATVNSCEFCANTGSCSTESCPGTIDPNNNAVCGGGSTGGCGNGNCDPDENPTLCSSDCNGTPPSSWTCDASWYGDGDCDCGCGALDADCASNDYNNCVYHGCDMGYLPSQTQIWECVDACGNSTCETFENPTLCGSDCDGSTPSEWTCNTSYYGDGDCDCGCGALDADCSDRSSGICEYQYCSSGDPIDGANWLCQ